jgi:hypothetical protein
MSDITKTLKKLTGYLDMVAGTGFFTDKELQDIKSLENELSNFTKEHKEIRFYNILAEAPVRGIQRKRIWFFAEDEAEKKRKLTSLFEDELKSSEKLDGNVDIVSEQSWNWGNK